MTTQTEKILVIPSANLNKIISLSHLKYYVNTDGRYNPRDVMETNTNFVQIIPYIVCTSGDNIFVYERLKKGTEARLHNLFSIGVGGHVDLDEDYWEGASTWASVESCAYRELVDELTIGERTDTVGKDSEVIVNFTDHIIYDPSNSVGQVHLGVVCTADLSHRSVHVQEIEKLKGEFHSIDKVRSMLPSMENWSKIAFEKLYGSKF